MAETGVRAKLRDLVEHSWFQNAVLGVILLNSAILGLETSRDLVAVWGPLLHGLDLICLGLFTAEIALKLVAHDLRFFRNGWNVFDFVVVAIAFTPSGQGLAVLRALRIFRALRLFSVVPSMRRLVSALVMALPGVGSAILMLGIIFYVSAVVATTLFSEAFPDWFGHLGRSLFSLFQIMTLESWSMGIARPVMEVYPHAWAFFIPFILASSFTVLNLFIGIIVDAMSSVRSQEHEERLESEHENTERALAAIDARLAEIESHLRRTPR